MSELTAFLLARIAEDEARAADQEHALALAQNGSAGLGGLEWVAPQWHAYEQTGFTPSRIRAECVAKRRVVRTMQFNVGWRVHRRTRPLINDTMQAYILRLLAVPYADHPDYRQEWKP